jgi:hypothetical protein
MKKHGVKFLLVLLIVASVVAQIYIQQVQARGGFLNNKPLPSSECMICPYDGNQGRILYLRFDSQERQWMWTVSCYKNHIWECYANPQR